MSQGFKREKPTPEYPFWQLIEQFQAAARSTSPDMTTVFHAWSYGRFKKIQSCLSRNKLHRTNQGFNFLGGRFSNRGNVKAPAGCILDLHLVWLWKAAPFCKNCTKLYFDVKHLEKWLAKEGRWNFWCPFFKKSALFH